MSDDTDTSLFQLDGYNLIAQGKRCSTRRGLIIYLKDTIEYKLIQANSNIWEGQFILEKPVFSEYFDAVTALNFSPKITLPTRFSKGSCTLIDNFLCKCSHRLSECIAGILLNEISDHLPYFISMNNVNIKCNKTIINIKQQNESNVTKFEAEMSEANFDSKLDLRIDADPNINYDILELTITDAANKHLPTKTILKLINTNTINQIGLPTVLLNPLNSETDYT